MTRNVNHSNLLDPEQNAPGQNAAHSSADCDAVNNAAGLYRRDLFRLFGAGLVMLVAAGDADAQESGGGGRRRPDAAPRNIGAWLHIDAQGNVTVYTGKVEVGQNARTSLTQAVAEELRVPISAIQVLMADTALTPYDFGTVGSRTTPSMVPQLRQASAAAREVVIDLAAAQWQTDRAGLTATDGKVHQANPSRAISYGELLKGQKLTQMIRPDIALTPTSEWKVMGTSVPKVDGRAFVTGRHRYTSDMKREGMLYGKILRPAAFHAPLKTLDASAVKALPNVTVVQDGDFVGVVAASPRDATRALAALKAEWQTVPQPSGQTLYEQLRPAASGVAAAAGVPGQAQASAPAGSSASSVSDRKVQATYTVAYIAHAPLEPRAALAEWKEDALTVWTGTQRPFGVRGELASALHIPEDKIRVIVPDTGSGYGGKHTGEVAVEAARLARVVGKPVKLVWTREEEFTWAYFRPAGVIDVSGSLNPNGTLAGWEMHNYNSGPSGIQCPYQVANPVTQFHRAQAPLREGSYRGLASTANHFARESHIDDLAHAAKMEPLAFRLKNLKDERLRNVLLAAAARFEWDKCVSTPMWGYGIACGTEKGSYVANCVEVKVDAASGKVQVTRIVTAFECGAVVNPTHLQNQVEGAVVQGLGGALFEAIHFDAGKILNAQFSAYRVPRFADVPPIDVVLLDRKDLPSQGAGETPIVTIAPAIGNAIFAATGRRLRTMPLVPDGLKAPQA